MTLPSWWNRHCHWFAFSSGGGQGRFYRYCRKCRKRNAFWKKTFNRSLDRSRLRLKLKFRLFLQKLKKFHHTSLGVHQNRNHTYPMVYKSYINLLIVCPFDLNLKWIHFIFLIIWKQHFSKNIIVNFLYLFMEKKIFQEQNIPCVHGMCSWKINTL